MGGAVRLLETKFFKSFWLVSLALTAFIAAFSDNSQAAPPVTSQVRVVQKRSLDEWLLRMNEASRNRAYTGTFVVSAGPLMSSARIWHVCDGRQQLERVDTLSGAPRTTVRRNDEVITFVPEERLAVVEHRDALGLFPALLQTSAHALSDFYVLRDGAVLERVAGFDADVVELQPMDDLRFGYRIWSERKTGLVVKLQTLDAQQRVLEQVAFSALNLDAPLRVEQVLKWMKNRPGYTVQQLQPSRSTPQAQGWRLKHPVPGFETTAVHLRPPQASDSGAGQSSAVPVQWVFSDGLAAVSLFIEPFDPARHVAEVQLATGATHSVSQRLGSYWVTAVGEVPYAALTRFAQSIERSR
jgi:sigma-E factor negative regulatory protein RseB